MMFLFQLKFVGYENEVLLAEVVTTEVVAVVLKFTVASDRMYLFS